MPTNFNAGDQIELVHTNDPFTRLVPGHRGVITRIDTDGFGDLIFVRWENGSSLTMLPAEGDIIRKVS